MSFNKSSLKEIVSKESLSSIDVRTILFNSFFSFTISSFDVLFFFLLIYSAFFILKYIL